MIEYSIVSFTATVKVCVVSEQLEFPVELVTWQVIEVSEGVAAPVPWRTTNVVVSAPLLEAAVCRIERTIKDLTVHATGEMMIPVPGVF